MPIESQHIEHAQQHPRLIVFADDWGRHPSSCQHLVRYLLDRCEVSWINTIGTRSPRLNWTLLRRGFEKLRQWGSRTEEGEDNGPLKVFNPAMYPGFRSAWQRELNARLLMGFLTKKLPGVRESVILSTLPIVADLVGRVPVRRWVYYCVDDFSAWPGLDSRPMREMEEKLIAKVDRIVAAGPNLSARIARSGRDSEVISHGIDLGFWTAPSGPCELLAGLERPIVVFWGLVDQRIDVSYLKALDQRMSRGTIALVGPEADADQALGALRHVKRLGVWEFEGLPAVASEAQVLIMPYADLEVTRAMQPLKLKEYLATGKPVVSSRLPALTGWEDCLDIADSAEEFAALVVERLGQNTPRSQVVGRLRLEKETWQLKSVALTKILFGD